MLSLLRVSIVFINFMRTIESSGLKGCGEYGVFLFWGNRCYWAEPTVFLESFCKGFDFKPFNASHLNQGLILRIENKRGFRFWPERQKNKVVYYETDPLTEIRFPFNLSDTEYVRMFITPSEKFLGSLESGKFYVEGTEFQAMNGKKWIDLLSVSDSPLIVFLLQEDDKFQFIYIDSGKLITLILSESLSFESISPKPLSHLFGLMISSFFLDTKKSGTISIALQGNRTIGSVVTTLRTCDDLKFLMIQDRMTSVVEIFIYSLSKVLAAADQGMESYTFNITHSIDFKPFNISLEKNSCQPIRLEYPYETQVFVITQIDPAKIFVIIPNITCSEHYFDHCRVQDEKNGVRLAVCPYTYESGALFFTSYISDASLIGFTLVYRYEDGKNSPFSVSRSFLEPCYFNNDCYGCHLMKKENCSWDGGPCTPGGPQKPFQECITLSSIFGNARDGVLEVHVEGVRLTNARMDIAIFTPENVKIVPQSIHDYSAIFQIGQTLLTDYLAGNTDLFFQVNNTVLDDSLVRLKLRETPPESGWVLWAIVIILSITAVLSVILFVLSRQKSTKDNQGKKKAKIWIKSLLN